MFYYWHIYENHDKCIWCIYLHNHHISIICLKKLVSEEKGISKQNHIMATGFIGEQEITMVIIGTSLVVQGLRI